jgi:hypothetical protein
MRKLLIVGNSLRLIVMLPVFFIGMASEVEYAEVGTWQNSLRISSSNCWLLRFMAFLICTVVYNDTTSKLEAVWTQLSVQMKLLISSHDVGSQLDQSDVCPSNREKLHWASVEPLVLQMLGREPVEPQRPDILWVKL